MRVMRLAWPAVCCALWINPLVTVASFGQNTGPAEQARRTPPVRFEESARLRLAEPLPHAFRIATADLNSDGKPDVVVGTSVGIVLLVQGSSEFEPGRVIPVPSPCPIPDLAIADLDRDGTPDLAVYCASAGKVFTYRGRGNGEFLAPGSIATAISTGARGLAAADLNQDGIVDLALDEDGKVAMLLGNGDATFRSGAELQIASSGQPARPTSLTVGDFNGDGIPDLATANYIYNDDVSVFLATGGGLFGAERRVGTLDRPHDLIAIDFNRDGKLDLAVACDYGLLLFSGDGRGSFQAGPKVPTEADFLSVATADLNNDGLPDFVMGGYYGGVISVALSNGDGTFRVSNTPLSIGDTFGVVLADVNGDSRPDLIASSYSGSSALLAFGRAGGEFERPTYFGAYPANSFLMRLADVDCDSTTELIVVLQGRRAVKILQRASGRVSTIHRDDYPLDAVFADFTGDRIVDLALVTVPFWAPSPGADFKAAIYVLPGRGDGTFAAEIVTPVDQCPAYQGYGSLTGRFLNVAAGDYDNDGIRDIALVNSPLGELQIYHGNGNGTFGLTRRFPIGTGGVVASGDFSRDGVADLALFAGQVNLYLGGSTGSGMTSISGPGCGMGGSLQTADFDGDRESDLLLNCANDVSILLNLGGGRFRIGPKTAIYPPLTGITAIADFDRDGRDDLAAITYVDGKLALFLSAGDGAFRTPVVVPTLTVPVSMIAVDFDDDGKPDLVAIDESDGSLELLRNKPAERVGPPHRPIPRSGSSRH